MNNKSYYLCKTKNKSEISVLELDKIKGYEVRPKVMKKGSIEVSKIIFINQDISEKIIRKKIDKKIEYLLNGLRDTTEEGSSEGTIRRNLVDAEKLRVQIINNYIKYLGNTYGTLTIEKLKIIINEYRLKLWTLNEKKVQNYFNSFNREYDNSNERTGHRGR